MPWTPRKLVHIRCSIRAFSTSTRGAFENFEPGALWYNVTPLYYIYIDDAPHENQRMQPRSQGFSLFVIGKSGKGPGTGRSHDFQHPDIVGVNKL
jgi:hypothetical protein